MPNLPKFLFCENPLLDERHDGRSFILHARRPLILAEVFHFNSSQEKESMQCKSAFNVGASLDYSSDEYIILGAVWIESNLLEKEIKTLPGIMRRMADWYEAYLIWEDKQNFENEE